MSNFSMIFSEISQFTFAGSSVAFAQDSGATAVPAGSAPMTTSSTGTATTAGAPGAPAQGFSLQMFLPFILMFGVVYFLMIRPQQKKMKEHQSLLGSLKVGDEVVTNSGMLGTVSGMADKVVTLEVANNVKVKFLKSQVAQVVKGPIKDLAPNP